MKRSQCQEMERVMNISYYAKQLYTESPQIIVNKLKRRLHRNGSQQYTLEEIYSSKNQRPQRLFDLLNRYETVLHREHGWQTLNFTGKNVLEIGSGPLLGWAPLAIFRGARHVDCVEVMYNPVVLQSHDIIDRYFLKVWRDLSAIYGNSGYSFKQFLTDLRQKVTIHPCYFLKADIRHKWDISLSNSCLEHVSALKENIVRLKQIACDGCRFIHLVDFGNHNGQKRHPLESIYDRTPEEYIEQFGAAINLWRPSDVLRRFREAGFDTRMTPLYYATEGFPDEICGWWRQRYNEEELYIRVALISSDP